MAYLDDNRKKLILSSPSTDFTAVEGQNQIKMFYFVFESAVSVQKHEFFAIFCPEGWKEHKEPKGNKPKLEKRKVARIIEMAGILNAQYTGVFTREDTANLPEPEKLFTGDDALSEMRFEEGRW